MNIDMRDALLRTTAIVALAFGGAVSASAQTSNGVVVNGGGSTLAGGDYETIYGLNGLTTIQSPLNSLSCPANGSSTQLSIYYGFAGSGKGATGFINNDSTQIGCQGNGLADDFGAADVPVADVYSVPTGNPFGLASNQGAAYFKDLYGYQMIQVPGFGTPVTVPFEFSQIASPTNGSIALTDNDLCGIFSGKITTWNKISSKPTSQPLPIAVSYRQDSSGTSFLLTNHLAKVCTANTSKITWQATTKFASLFPGATTDSSGNYHVPSGTFAADISAVGSGGVQVAIERHNDSLGYLTPDYTQIAAVPQGTAPQPFVASVNKILPTVNATALGLSSLKPGAVCTNPDSFGVTIQKPTTAGSYPVVGYTFLYFSSAYRNAGKVSVVKTWLDALYNVNNTGDEQQSVDAIKNGGFSPIPGVTDSATPAANSFASKIVKCYLAAKATVPFVVSSSGR